MVPDVVYDVARYIASALVVGAILAFLVSYLRRVMRHKSLLRTISIIALVPALLVLLFVRSPLDYRAAAPAPADADVYVLSRNLSAHSDDLFAVRATDGKQLFLRHLPAPELQSIVYDIDGLLILAGTNNGVFDSTHGYERRYPDNDAVMRAFHRDDGSDALPALATLRGISASTVDHGVLYVAAIDNSQISSEKLYAFSLRTGEVLWHQTLATSGRSQIFGIDQGVLYIWSGTTLAAVRVMDGAPIWERALTTTIHTPVDQVTYYGMLYAGMLYIWLDTTVAAVRLADGALVWQSSPLATHSEAIGPFAPPESGGVYVQISDHTLYGVSLVKLDARDGSTKWTLPRVSPVAISGNRLYGIQHSNLTAFDTSTGAPVWQQQGVTIFSDSARSVTAVSGVIYVDGWSVPPVGLPIGSCKMFAIRMSDDAELWRRPSSLCESHSTQSPLAADGVLYYMEYGGYLTVMRAADGSILWTHPGYRTGGMFDHWADTFDVVATSPGVIFVDSDHAATCSIFRGCNHDYARSCQFLLLDCSSEVGHYLEAVDPATSRIFWRYRVDDSNDYIFDDGAA